MFKLLWHDLFSIHQLRWFFCYDFIQSLYIYSFYDPCYSVFFNLNLVWELYWNVAFVNFITLIAIRWFGQFITSRQLFLAIKLIAFFHIWNSKCTGAQLWNSQTGFKLKKKHYSVVHHLSFHFCWPQDSIYSNCKLKTLVYSCKYTTFLAKNNKPLCGKLATCWSVRMKAVRCRAFWN